MFVVEVVAALTTVIFAARADHGRGAISASRSRSSSGCGSPCCSPTSRRRSPRGAARRRPIRCGAQRTETQAKLLTGARQELPTGSEHQPQGRRHRPGRGRRYHSLRRRGDRRHRLGQRGGDHRRIGAGHPRGGRRPLGRHRRHAGAVRLDLRAHHGGARLDLPRPHDPAGRGRRAPEDPERDRAQHPARRHDDHLRRSPRPPSRASQTTPAARFPIVVVVALFVTLIPTTIGALLSAIGIAGMDRLVRFNVLACRAGRSRRRATSTRCCSTRPAPSRWATGRRPSSSRCAA